MDLLNFISPDLRFSDCSSTTTGFPDWTYFFPLDTGFALRYGLLQLWSHWDTLVVSVVNRGTSCFLYQAMELTLIGSVSTSLEGNFE